MNFDFLNEFKAALAIRHTSGLGPKSWRKLVHHYGSLTEAASEAGKWSELGLVRSNAASAFMQRQWRNSAEEEFRSAQEAGFSILVVSDPRFPDLLRQIPDPPLYLYYKGDVSALAIPAVAVVGARLCSNYGLEAASMVSDKLSAAGICIVSGMAAGIDRQAHLAGLRGIGKSIGVLGTGLDRVYPSSNRDLWDAMLANGGLIVTEFAPGTLPEGPNFPVRNRIISGLSLGVLVAEAAEKSGSLITAKLATEQGREVFALPGPLTQPTFVGCHSLIRQGACLVEDADDILRELRIQLQAYVPDGKSVPPAKGKKEIHTSKETASAEGVQGFAIPDDIAPEEKSMLEALFSNDRIHIDDLGRMIGVESADASRMLLMLELRGLVRQWPGMYYSLG